MVCRRVRGRATVERAALQSGCAEVRWWCWSGGSESLVEHSEDSGAAVVAARVVNLVATALSADDEQPKSPGRRPNQSQIAEDRQRRLFDEFQAIQASDAWTANSAGFLPSALIQASLPYKNPGDVPEYVKVNGDVGLIILPGRSLQSEQIERNGTTISVAKPVNLGYPYGSIPRLVLAWITTQAITLKTRDLRMGRSLTDFMRLLGIYNVSGGDFGSIKRLKDQTHRLLACRMSLHRAGQGSTEWRNFDITDTGAIYDSDASTRGPDKVFGSTITLDKDFFTELLANPVPLDFRALKLLRQSPLSLDLYCWLTYTMFSLRRDCTVSWHSLHNQFGNGASEKKFRELFRASLQNVLRIYPDARVSAGPSGVLLQPSPTHVPVRRSSFPSAAIARVA